LKQIKPNFHSGYLPKTGQKAESKFKQPTTYKIVYVIIEQFKSTNLQKMIYVKSQNTKVKYQ
jgi:hypothetical protein